MLSPMRGGRVKKPEEVMEILEAYDLAGSLRGAAQLAGCEGFYVKSSSRPWERMSERREGTEVGNPRRCNAWVGSLVRCESLCRHARPNRDVLVAGSGGGGELGACAPAVVCRGWRRAPMPSRTPLRGSLLLGPGGPSLTALAPGAIRQPSGQGRRRGHGSCDGRQRRRGGV